MRVADAVEEYLAVKKPAISHSTYAWYDTFLQQFLAWIDTLPPTLRPMELNEIQARHIAKFVEDCPTENTHTRHARAQIVKGFLNWCSKDPTFGVSEIVVKRIEMPRLVQSEVELFEFDDIMKLMHACRQTQQPWRNAAIIHILLDTGVRAAELCVDNDRPGEQTGLLLENVLLSRDESFIRVMGKGRKVRTLPLGQEASLSVRRYLNRERHGHCAHLLISREGDALSVRMLEQLLDELGKLTGVERVHPHRFRHTFAVNQLLAGTKDLVLMRLLGHTTLDTTKIYTRAMSDLQARSAAISVVDRMKRKQ